MRGVDAALRDSLVFLGMTREEPGKFIQTAQELFECADPLDSMDAFEECCQIVEDQEFTDTLTEDNFLVVAAHDDEISDELFNFIFELVYLYHNHAVKPAITEKSE